MDQNENLKHYLKTLEERHVVLRNTVKNLLRAFTTGDKDIQYKSTNSALVATQNLAVLIYSQGRPRWLNKLIDILTWFKSNQDNNEATYTTLLQLITIYDQIENHQWGSKNETGTDYNFDAVYEQFREESRLTELFDAAIDILEKIVASGEIDSLQTINALEGMIATIRQNKSGSYFSTISTLEFVRHFSRNYLLEQVRALPGVGPMVKAFDKTVSELNIEVKLIQDKITKKMEERFRFSFRLPTYKTSDTVLLETDKRRELDHEN